MTKRDVIIANVSLMKDETGSIAVPVSIFETSFSLSTSHTIMHYCEHTPPYVQTNALFLPGDNATDKDAHELIISASMVDTYKTPNDFTFLIVCSLSNKESL